MRINVGHISRPQVRQRKLEGATNDNSDVVKSEDFQQIVKHRFVFLFCDDDERHDVDNDAKDGKCEDHLMKHLVTFRLLDSSSEIA